jgi:hypothetical protein
MTFSARLLVDSVREKSKSLGLLGLGLDPAEDGVSLFPKRISGLAFRLTRHLHHTLEIRSGENDDR